MNTVIAGDRIGRFAELDHAVRDELQAIVETGAAIAAAEERTAAPRLALRRLLTTLRAGMRLSEDL